MKLLICIALVLCTQAHASLEVYDSTCALPKAPVHKWYIDPVKGDDVLGDGSALKPWKTIQSIFQGQTIAAVPAVPATATTPAIPGKPLIYVGAKYQVVPSYYGDPVNIGRRIWGNDPKAPVKPGDALELATGNYGDVGIGAYTYWINPDQFLTIEPVAGAKPVFTSLKILGAGHLYIHDIKMQNTANGGTLVYLGSEGALPVVDYAIADKPATDIIFDRMAFTSFDTTDPSTILAADWNVKPANGMWMYPMSTNCISVTNSTFTGLAGPVAVGGQKAVIKWNKMNYFRDDGLDFFGNDLRIANNTFTNSIATTAIHKDFFQGQIGHRIPGTTTNHYRNILIDHNTMIGKTEAKNLLYTYTQGINTFDEDWSNLVVTNNIIIAANCHGIGFGSVHGGEIANNIVLHDLLAVTPGCTRGGIGAAGGTHASAVVTSNIHVHHNITQTMSIDLDHGNTWDNNLLTGNDGQYVPLLNGAYNWNYTPPLDDVNNNRLERQFTGYNPAAFRFNMAIQPGSLGQTMKAGPQ